MDANVLKKCALATAVIVIFAAAAPAQSQTPPKMKMTTPIPASVTTPDSVDTSIGTLKFFDGFPNDATVTKLYDNLDRERGVQAFLVGMPGRSASAQHSRVFFTRTLRGAQL